MTKDKLMEKIKDIPRTDLDFLSGLKKKEHESLVACIRDMVVRRGG